MKTITKRVAINGYLNVASARVKNARSVNNATWTNTDVLRIDVKPIEGTEKSSVTVVNPKEPNVVKFGPMVIPTKAKHVAIDLISECFKNEFKLEYLFMPFPLDAAEGEKMNGWEEFICDPCWDSVISYRTRDELEEATDACFNC